MHHQTTITPHSHRSGAEALARWRHEDGRLLAAGEFIEVAEASGLIEPIGYRVLARACIEACRWPPQADGTPRVLRANLSARQFAHAGLLGAIQDALAASGLAPDRLCLEITETTLMQTAVVALGTLDSLRALGIRLAIDDFGTGYSSLAYLRRFPVDTLKLDKAMIDDLASDGNARAIVTAVRDMARALSLEVVVEGIERVEQDVAPARTGSHARAGLFLRPPATGAGLRRAAGAGDGRHAGARRADDDGDREHVADPRLRRAGRRVGGARDDALDRRRDGEAEDVAEDHRVDHPALGRRAPGDVRQRR